MHVKGFGRRAVSASFTPAVSPQQPQFQRLSRLTNQNTMSTRLCKSFASMMFSNFFDSLSNACPVEPRINRVTSHSNDIQAASPQPGNNRRSLANGLMQSNLSHFAFLSEDKSNKIDSTGLPDNIQVEIPTNSNFASQSIKAFSSMCLSAINELLADRPDAFNHKILDYSAGAGSTGQLLVDHGYSEVYAQEGTLTKKQALERKGIYKDIETYIVGRQALPVPYRKTFDIVTCAGGLGTHLLPASCFNDMLWALKPGGHVVFTLSQKHLEDANPFGTGYREAIDRLLAEGSWQLIRRMAFIHCKDQDTCAYQETFALMIFKKK